MKKSIWPRTMIASVAMIAAGLMAGCTQGSATNPGGDSTGSDGEVTVRFMNFSSNDGHEADLQTIVDAFERDNPGVKIAVETSPFAGYAAKLQTAVAGGAEADVFELPENSSFVSYAQSGALADISGLDTSAYAPSLIAAYADAGKQYALPVSFSNVVLLYNKDLFDAAGLSYPTADWTWADERAAAERLTDRAAGVWGDYQPISYNEFYKALAQSGGSFLNAAGAATAFNSEAGLQAVRWLTGKSGVTMPTDADGANTPDFDTTLFISGQLAMWHTGIWNFGAVMEKAPNLNWDIVVEPGNTQNASAMFSNAVAISAKSKVQEAAQRWLVYYTSSQTTIDTRLATSWELPPVADQAKLDAYLTITPPAHRQAVFDSLQAVALAPVMLRQEEIQDIVNDELAAVAAGRATPEVALSNMQSKVDLLLK